MYFQHIAGTYACQTENVNKVSGDWLTFQDITYSYIDWESQTSHKMVYQSNYKIYILVIWKKLKGCWSHLYIYFFILSSVKDVQKRDHLRPNDKGIHAWNFGAKTQTCRGFFFFLKGNVSNLWMHGLLSLLNNWLNSINTITINNIWEHTRRLHI